MDTAPPSTSPLACNTLTPERRGACRRERSLALQRSWLAELAWDTTGTAVQVQLWLGVFPVNWHQLPDAGLLARQINTIRRSLGGSYGQLLTAMVLDPALQISLNGPANHRRQPNENLARELLELFVLGEGNYSEADVREAARALTGYRLSSKGELVLDPRRHDPGLKTILGRTEAFTGESLVGWLAEQPATAPYISGRIWRQLVGTPPKPQRLQALAADWRQRQLSIPWLLTTIQATPEATQSRERGLRLADPLEVAARSLRLLGSRHRDALGIGVRAAAAMGQAPFEPPSVKGWPVNEQWLNLRWLQAWRRGLQQLLTDEEVWASAALPAELSPHLTPIPPLGLRLLAPASRENVAALWADPVMQLSRNVACCLAHKILSAIVSK